MSTRSRASVFGLDEQPDVVVDLNRWVALAEAVLDAQKVPGRGELSLLFVAEAEMAELNERHMGSEGPTDVLAFPLEEEGLEPGRWPDNGTAGPDRPGPLPDDMPLLLGDVVICPSVAARQAPEHAGSAHHAGRVEDEIALLVVHGILHILGMDHAAPDETTTMQALERDLLGRFHADS